MSQQRIKARQLKPLKVYVDGSCRPSTKLGAWAALFVDSRGHKLIIKGTQENITNNIAELQAFIEALKFIKLHELDKFNDIEIISDSQYVVNGTVDWYKKWKMNNYKTSSGEPVKNLPQWKEVERLTKEVKCSLSWCKGHAKTDGNNEVDKIVFELTAPK